MRKVLAIFLLACSAGCSSKALPPIIDHDVIEVEVPIYVKAPMPDELIELIKFEKPVFVSPDDANASSALTEEGERNLKTLFILIRDIRRSVRAWNDAD